MIKIIQQKKSSSVLTPKQNSGNNKFNNKLRTLIKAAIGDRPIASKMSLNQSTKKISKKLKIHCQIKQHKPHKSPTLGTLKL